MPKITVRQAIIEDADLLLGFIYELAKMETAEHEVKNNKELVSKFVFGKNATTHAVICELEGKPIGHAIYFFNYSTRLGKNGLYIEDLYISPMYRNCGAGREIIKHLSCLALKKDCSHLELAVYGWNQPAVKFYESLGGEIQNGLFLYRFSGNNLKQVICS